MHQRPDRLPLLTAQAGILYAQQLAPESTALNTADRVEIQGPLDTALFETALRRTMDEAETLALRVGEDADGTPWQEVAPAAAPVRLHRLDLRTEADPERAAEAWMRADLARPVDLTRPADGANGLVTQALIRLTDDRHWWYQRVHHFAVDAYALQLIGSRVAELYTALATGQQPLPERRFAPLAELTDDERHYLDGEQYATDRAFWAERTAGHTPPVTPATRAARPGAPDLPRRRAADLPDGSFERISRAAQAVKATWAEVVIAATAGHLHRVTGAEEIVLGLPLTNRRGPAALRTPAMTVNVMPLRIAVRPRDTGAELLRRVVLEIRAVRRHQRYPQADLRRDLALGTAGEPLTGPMVNIKPFETDLDFADLPGTVHNLAAGPVEDLAVGAAPRADGTLRLTLDAHAGRYGETELARHERTLLTYLDALTDLLLTDPHRPIGTLDLLTPDEIRAATAGRAEPPAEHTLPEAFAAQAARTPDAVAVRSGGAALTFRELDEAANRLAHRLATDLAPGTPVALALPRSTGTVVALLAVLKARGVCQPLDLGHPAARTLDVLADARPAYVIGTRATLAALPDHQLPVLALDDPDTAAALADLPATPLTASAPAASPRPGDPAYVIHTSGSTGRPKGVLVTHASLANLLAGHGEDHVGPALARTGRDRLRVAHSASFAFDASWDPVLWMVHGHELHLLDDAAYRDPAVLAAYVDEHRVDYLDVTPSYAEALVAEGLLDEGRHRPAVVVVGGEAVPGPLWERLASTPGTRPINLYGPTETTVDAYYWLPGPDGSTTGHPVRASRVYVLDSSLRPAPPGVTGELYVAGACLARGYLGRPDLTAERFVADPFGPLHGDPGGRMYRTGDLVRRRDDGTLEFLGRGDDQVKIRGFRVELGEIQARLATHPAVAQAAVIARDTPHGKRLLAYAVPRGAANAPGEAASAQDAPGRGTPTGAPVTPADLRAHLAEALPAHMVPATVTLLDALPRTANDKLDHRALPDPEPALTPGADSPADPHTEVLCGLFADVLGLESRWPSPDATFFDLGGHSLLAGRLAARIRERFGASVGIADVFKAPTPAALAALVRTSDITSEGTAPVADSVPVVPRTDTLPLSPAQQRLWFLHRLEGPSPTYNIPLVLTLDGPVDHRALTLALHDLSARHETLRTVYPTTDNAPESGAANAPDDRPHQRVLASDHPLAQPVLHHAPLVPGALPEAVRHCFDLAAEPPLRATLFTDPQDPTRHTLLLLLHHIAGDGASTTPLSRDLATAYTARGAGHAPAFAPLPFQYADHAAHQQKLLADGLADTHLAYWKDALAGLPDQLELPTDRPRPPVASSEGDTVPFSLGPAAHRALKQLAAATGTTVFMTVQAGLAALLTRHGCGTDIPLGTPVAGRDDDATADLVGFFTNTVVLRTDTSGDPGFRTLLDRVRDATLAAYAHDALPFDQLVEELNPPRSLARHPLFQVMLAWQSIPDGPFALGPDTTARLTAVPSGTAKFDLTLNAGELAGEQGISGFLEFRTDLFDRTTAQALADRLTRLLTAAAATPDTPLGLLPLLGADEHHHALVTVNDQGPRTSSTPATLADVYETAAAQHPHRTAVSHDGHTLTYAELSARAHRLARLLAARGIGPGAIVALALPRSADLVTGLLAVALSGAAYLPLDPDYPADRLSYMLGDARPAALLTDTATAPRLPAEAHALPLIAVDGDAPAAYDESPLAQSDRTRPLTPDDPAYVIYTSGSTGRPKGVVVTHHNVTRLLTATDHWFRFDEHDVWTLFHSYAFDFSVWELWGALGFGGRLVVVPHLTSRDPAAFRALLADERVTVLNQTPSAFYQLAAADREARDGRELALRYVVFGGEALELARLDEWYERHADDSPTLVNMYGITETTVHVSYFALDRATAAASTSSTIGVNIPDLRVYVLDDRLNPCPPGVTGEMYVAGEGLARGYLGRPDLTATRFVADPYAHLFGERGARMYRSGDLARRRADGSLEYFGRADHQVKIRGFRIELGEIEAVLAAHPAVADAAVVVREDVPGDKRLVGYAVTATGTATPTTATATPAELREHAAGELPAHMVPSAVVLLDRLPLTSNGKLDRKALPAPERPTAATAGRAPRTPREEQLCAIFAEVLGLAAGSVGIDGNFFELGGHSLLAVRLAGRVQAAFGTEVSIGTVFQSPTPAGLDAFLDSGGGQAGPLDVLLPLRPAREGDRAPLHCVHPAGGLSWCYAGLIRHLPADVPIYGLQAQGVGAATAADPLPGTLEELAAHYVSRLREVQPTGPYRLLGWSTGGIIAHAMATHLQELGHEVELLAILDAYPAEGFRELPESDEAEALESLLTMGGHGPDSLAGADLTTENVIGVLRREGSPLAALPPATFEALRDIYLNTNHLVRGYDHRRFDGDVLFFRATVDTIDDTLTPETWTPYVGGRIANTDVACSHKDMTLPEPIAHIARVVAARLTDGPGPMDRPTELETPRS
ncbi:non-ribosomal peptide synthetase [Streptomyces sp. WAC 01529]|uniref:amino acid adenylation domain-containing protein n=1 Tax=Streptomyces sp. WAC 01529 TaxID=2203205 RepID=UPI000F715B72|nr:non-ribosomal peptide synthetase [Streptomyces sp. WAC 01529]AZM53797.1 non-ribosomal peptide synthetase [Streptomyces sp. WAC 01529]